MDNYHKISIIPMVLSMPVIIYLMFTASDTVGSSFNILTALLLAYCFITGICLSDVESQRREIRKIIKNGKCTVGRVKKIIVVDRFLKGTNIQLFRSYILEVEAETEFRKTGTYYSMPVYAWRKKRISQTARVYTWNNRYFVWHEKFNSKSSYLMVKDTHRRDEVSFDRLTYDVMTCVGYLGLIFGKYISGLL